MVIHGPKTEFVSAKAKFVAIQLDTQSSSRRKHLVTGGKVASVAAVIAILVACGGSKSSPPAPVVPPVVVVPPTPPVQAATCVGASAVPFTRFGTEKNPLTLTAQNSFCVGASGKSLDFGQDIPVFISEVADEDRIYYAREAFTSELSIYSFNGTDITKVTLPDDQRKALHPEHAFSLGNRHVFIAYNVETSIPSGREFGQLSEGLSVWRVDNVGSGANAILSEVTNIDIPGGMEANLHSVDYQGGRAICQNLDCRLLTVDSGGGVSETPLALNLNSTGFSPVLVELASDGTNAFALIKREFDDRLQPRVTANDPNFFICPVGTNAGCTNWTQNGTPFELTVSGGAASARAATTPVEQAEMLRYDLERLRQTGVTTLGENNIEGRLAWSAVYYWNGLTTLAANAPGLGAEFDSLRQDAETRLNFDLDMAAAQFGPTDPRMAAKRYSLNREFTTSLLHIGRIGRAFLRAEEAGVYQLDTNRDIVFAEMLPTAKNIEVINRNTTTGRIEFRIRPGSPFWADGSNSPWNYQSGWVDGLSYLNAVRPDLTAPFVSDATGMATQFIADENITALPNDWRYAGGLFFDGWTAADNVSTNTPDFPGDKINTSTAHISYRVMDVIALSEANRAGFISLDPTIAAHFAMLADEGRVYPFVMEALAKDGHTLALPDHLAQSYRRISYAYDLQSAAWVMSP